MERRRVEILLEAHCMLQAQSLRLRPSGTTAALNDALHAICAEAICDKVQPDHTMAICEDKRCVTNQIVMRPRFMATQPRTIPVENSIRVEGSGTRDPTTSLTIVIPPVPLLVSKDMFDWSSIRSKIPPVPVIGFKT